VSGLILPGTRLTTEALLVVIKNNPGLTAWQLAKRLNQNPAVLSSRLKKLADQGRVQRRAVVVEAGRRGYEYYP
jgi:predicted transcriptional regulator